MGTDVEHQHALLRFHRPTRLEQLTRVETNTHGKPLIPPNIPPLGLLCHPLDFQVLLRPFSVWDVPDDAIECLVQLGP